LTAATERSIADHRPAISAAAAESGSYSQALLPAASVSARPERWLTWPDQTGI
jgi:hypothetical protein